MKKNWKKISSYALVVFLGIGATYATYSYIDSRKAFSSADLYNYGNEFDQKNVHLAAFTAEGYPDFTKAAENSIHAVVHIKSSVKRQETQQRRNDEMMDPFDYFFGPSGPQSQQPSEGFGSGVIISEDGYIMTNNHVIAGATDIEITLNDNSTYTAKLVGADPITDIALLKIEGAKFAYIPFGDSDTLKVGEWVLAVGNPFNLTSTVTAGIVSAKGRGGISGGQRNQNGQAPAMTIQSYIQTDAAINPGNSGGALVNTEGQLVGINTAIYSQTGSFAGYGFAVPISIAGKVVADLKEYKTVQRAMLGVEILDVSVAKKEFPDKTKDIKVNEGVYVRGFAEMSPAKQAGIEDGDVIVAINATKLRSVGELQDQVNRFRPGDKIKVTVKRNNADKVFDVTLKNNIGSTSVVTKEDGIALVGAAFKELSAEKKKELGISYGVEVAGVETGGGFSKEGITKGFVILMINNKPVSSPSEVESIIQTVASSKDKGLFISGFTANGVRKYYAIDLSE